MLTLIRTPSSRLAAALLAAGLIALSLVAAGSARATAPLNVTSDRAALNAYAAYLNAELRDAADGQADDSTYITGISNQCKGALAPLSQSSTPLTAGAQHTLKLLGEEMAGDLAVSFGQADLTASSKFATALTKLHWTRASGAGAIVRRYVNAQSALLGTATSDLCANALLAAAAPVPAPTGTKAFLKGYGKATLAASVTFTELLNVMQTYETAGEKSLVNRIATLSNEVSSDRKADLLQSGEQLSAVLEAT